MQDRAIAAIGEWQLEANKDLNPVDLYIENMHTDRDYQMLMLVFEIFNNYGILSCEFKGIDIEKVNNEKQNYLKYAYRNGSSRGGDITFTTKITKPDYKKIDEIGDNPIYKKNQSFKLIFNRLLSGNESNKEKGWFKIIQDCFLKEEDSIFKHLTKFVDNADKNERLGISIKILNEGKEFYLRDFDIVKNEIERHGLESKYKRESPKGESRTRNKVCSVSGNIEQDIYGFAGPFPISTVDKTGFVSGFFNHIYNWRNYPISDKAALKLELGARFIEEHLKASFYGLTYLIIPNPIISTDKDSLWKIITLLKTALQDENGESKEIKRRSEDRILKILATEKNYFNVDLVFYKTVQSSMKITLMLEEIMPSRFRLLFIDVPESVNSRKLFKNAIHTKKEGLKDLNFSFQIIRDFFDKQFLEVVNKIFLGKHLSIDYVFEQIITLIRKNFNKRKTSSDFVENPELAVLKAIMLINYLQKLNIIQYNKNYQFMEITNVQKKESRFNIEGFNEFVKLNTNFLDSDIKVGVFAVGVLVRFLYDIQTGSLSTSNPPFENKLRGYKLNPELLRSIYTEALDKIQKYMKSNYVYGELREIVNQNFILKSNELAKMSNNELSFYFVAGLEMGRQFKREKVETN